MKAPVGLLSDRTVLRQQDGGAPPRQVPRLRAQRSNESPSGAFKQQNGLAQQDGGASPRQVPRLRAQRSNESPSGAFKQQNGLAQQDGGASPRQVPRLRAQRSNESPSGAFKQQNGLAQQDGGASPRQVRICFSLTNTLPVCYLYSIETASLLTERCGAPQCRAAWMSMPTVWAALRNCCAKLSFFAIKEDV